MRLLMLSDARNPHTVRWVRALAERGLDTLLFSLQPAVAADYAGVANLRIETLGLPTHIVRGGHTSLQKLRYLLAVPRIRQLAREFRPDVCNAHFATSYGLLATLAGVRPLVVSVWGTDVYDAPGKARLMREGLKLTLRRATVVLSTSHVMADATQALVPRAISVTPFGVDTGRFAPAAAPTAPSTAVRVGIVKALERKYGIDVLLRAFALARTRAAPLALELLIAGDGSQRGALMELAESLGVSEFTKFLGRISYQNVHLVHQGFDIAVYPSVDRSETFGVSAVESQSCGVPVIASAIGGLKEVVVDGVTGLLVEPGNAAELAEAICRLAADPGLRRRLGAGARARVEQEYSLEHTVGLMVEQYELARASAR